VLAISNSCERAHDVLVKKGLVEKKGRGTLVDEYGFVGTEEHMLKQRDMQIAFFKKHDRRNTKWRVQSWSNFEGKG
jgi:hypothetical protein